MKLRFFNFLFILLISSCSHFGNDDYLGSWKVTKLQDYVYSITYADYDNALASQFMKKYDFSKWGCSSVAYKNFVGRNFDYPYDETAQFVIKVNPTYARHASVGTAMMPDLTEEVVSELEYNDLYRYLPYFTTDGINDVGVVVTAQSVPAGDQGTTFGTKRSGADLNVYGIVRYLLDNANSVDHAIKLLNGKNIYAPANRELHFMIADAQKSVVVELLHNKIKVAPVKVMTNYYLTTKLTPHAQGIERAKILKKNYKSGKTKKGMIELMRSVNYSKMYDEKIERPWYSEYNGPDEETGEEGLTIHSSPADYEPYLIADRKAFQEKERDGSVMMTLHTTVFDISKRKMTFIPYEQKLQYNFEVK